MKKSIYLIILAVITVGCVIGGSVYHVGGIGRNIATHFNRHIDVSDVSVNSIDKEEQEKFTGISADISVADLNIVEGDGYYLTLDCSEKFMPEYKVENGILTVKQQNDFNEWGWNMNNVHSEITITVPRGIALDSLSVYSDVGDLYVEGITAKSTTVDLSVGDIEFEDADLGDTEIEGDTGNISLDGVAFENLTINASVGDVDISAKQDLSGYSMELDTSIGDVEVNGHNYDFQYTKDGTTDRKIKVDGSTGDINLTY